eukprot:TRINITY_DN196_c0_g1_i9.p1 TRINITY_DN196_c0_g1~~TRINITY_DN196_c0_g1_i9.p1  ORF type:complete len:155 (+),score=39.90 TRINITY_DN196_c0_g1_i9:52-465(+)
MNSLTFLLPILLLINVVKTETFAEKLAIFVSDTPNGFTVSKMVRNGENCHCRVPGSSSSSSSSSPLVPNTLAGSSALTNDLDTTAAVATTDATTDATTTDAITTDATTAGTTGSGSAFALTAESDDTAPGSSVAGRR